MLNNKNKLEGFNESFESVLALYENFFQNLFRHSIKYLAINKISSSLKESLKEFQNKEDFLYGGKVYFTIRNEKTLCGYVEIPVFISSAQKKQVERIINTIKMNMIVENNLYRIPQLHQINNDNSLSQCIFMSSSYEESLKNALEVHRNNEKNLFIQFRSLNETIRRNHTQLEQLQNMTLFVNEVDKLFPLEVNSLVQFIESSKKDTCVILHSKHSLKKLYEQAHLFPLLEKIQTHHSFLYAIH